MPDCKKSRALYSTGVTGISFVCFALAATAVALPLWGYFVNPFGTAVVDRGHFGPWQVCKESYYGKTKCGDGVSRFQPIPAVKIAGYFSAVGVVLLAALSILNVVHLAMIVSGEKVVLRYNTAVISKFVLSLLTTMDSIVAAGLFSLQTDDKANSYQVSRGESFYMQIVVIILNFLLFFAALYDIVFARRAYGDPTAGRDPIGVQATTFNNPGFRERNHKGENVGVAMTDASGKPYLSAKNMNGNGATYSANSTSNGSSVQPAVTRSPLRSSLKKPKPKSSTDSGLGIQNPGFSGSSPTFNRNGSVKKVRIQTQSTAV